VHQIEAEFVRLRDGVAEAAYRLYQLDPLVGPEAEFVLPTRPWRWQQVPEVLAKHWKAFTVRDRGGLHALAVVAA
jgi:hypothetical protein